MFTFLDLWGAAAWTPESRLGARIGVDPLDPSHAQDRPPVADEYQVTLGNPPVIGDRAVVAIYPCRVIFLAEISPVLAPRCNTDQCPCSRHVYLQYLTVRAVTLPNSATRTTNATVQVTWISATISLHSRRHLQHLQRPTSSDFPKNITPVSRRGNGGMANGGVNRRDRAQFVTAAYTPRAANSDS